MGLQTKGGLPVKPKLSSFSLLDSDILDLLSGQPRDLLTRPPDSQDRFTDLREPELIYYLYKRNYSAAYYRLKKLTEPLPPQDAMAACLCAITATNRLLETVLDHCPPIREFQFRGVGKVSSLIAVTVAHDLSEALNSLLQRGADPNQGPNQEPSPLETAFTSQSLRCLEALLNVPDLEVSLTPPMLAVWGSLREGDHACDPLPQWCCELLAKRLLGTDGGPLGPVPIPPELRLKHVLASSNGELAARICRERPLTDEDLQDAGHFFSTPDRFFSLLNERCNSFAISKLQSRITFLQAFVETRPEALDDPALRSFLAETALALPEMDETLALCVARMADGPVPLRTLPKLSPFTDEPILFPFMQQQRLDPALFSRWEQRLGSRLIPTLDRNGPFFAQFAPEDIRLLLDHVTFAGKPEPNKLSHAAEAALRNAPEEQLSRLLQPGVLLAEEPTGKLLDACQRLPANRRNIVLAHIRKEIDYEL